jgi:hypothetical protein
VRTGLPNLGKELVEKHRRAAHVRGAQARARVIVGGIGRSEPAAARQAGPIMPGISAAAGSLKKQQAACCFD